MQKDIAKKLHDVAESVATVYSNPHREGNGNKETFAVHRITPLSDRTASVVYKKSSGKLAAFFFYYRNGVSEGWYHFVPSDSHLVGMHLFGTHKANVEAYNYKHNFE